jgi:hypothetical protein
MMLRLHAMIGPIAPGGMARTPEGEAQTAILDYLATKRVFSIRLNNQPIYDPKRGTFRSLPKHTPKGLSDILVVKKGKAIFSK